MKLVRLFSMIGAVACAGLAFADVSGNLGDGEFADFPSGGCNGMPLVIKVRDWTGKEVTTVRGVTFDGNFTLETADHFNGKVDYVSAFDGGKVVKNGVSAERASSSIVTYGGISGPFETEVFVQPYVPISTGANIPDPYGVKDPTKSGNWVYTGTTGNSVKLSQTSSSTSFPNLYYDVANFSGNYKNAVWAPEIHYVRGNWYLYFSASDTSDTNRERSFVMSYKGANSSGLTSWANWNTATRLVTPDDKWAIDGTVFEGRDGKLYYVWSGWAGNSNVRQDIYLAPMDTPTSFETGAKRTLVSMPDQSWETQPTDHPLVEEGPAVLQKGDKTIIVFSGNGSWKQYYSLGYTVCSDGNYTTASSWKKHDGTVFTRRSHAYGPGHCSFMKDGNGNDLIVYHATATATAPSGSDYWSIRDARIQPFAWHDDEPVFGAPCPTKGSGTPSGEAYDLTKSWTVDGSADKIFIHAPTAETVTGPSGTTVTPTFLGNEYFNIIGTTSLTEPKTVELTLVLKDRSKYAWDDGSTDTKACTFTAKFSGAIVQYKTLQTDGNGAILTDYVPNAKTSKIEVKFRTPDLTKDGFLFMSSYDIATAFSKAKGQTDEFGAAYWKSLSAFQFYNDGAGGNAVVGSGYSDSEKAHVLTVQGNAVTLDGTATAQISGTAQSLTAGSPLLLFAKANANGQLQSEGTFRVQYVKVWEGTSLVRDWTPAIDGFGVATLYDQVTKKCLEVSGGTFAVDNVVDPDAEEPPEPPDPTDVIASATVSGDVFRLTFRDVTKPLVLVMFSGATDRGDSYYNDPDAEEMPGWDVVAPVARLLPGTTTLDVPVPAGWGTTVKYARFFATAASKTPWKSLVSIGGTDPAAQWLDTGVVPDATLNTQLNFKPTSATVGKPLFAAATEGANSPYLRYGISLASDGKPTFLYSNSNATSGNGRGESFGSAALTVGVEYNALLQATSNRARVRPDGGSWSDSGTATAPTAAANGTIRVYGSCDITRLTVNTASYATKAYMMPALAYNEKGVLEACLYDSQSHALRFSLGSQPFAAGAETSYHQDLLRGVTLCGETATLAYQAEHTHAWGAWSADTATKDAGGTQTRTCACGATETRATPQRWDYLRTDGKGYCVIQGYRPNLAKGLIDMRVRFTQEQLDAIVNYYGLFVANARVGGSADYGNAVNFNLERPARGDFSGSLCSIDYYNNFANSTLAAADQHLYLGYDGDVETSHRFTVCGMSLLVDGVGQANHGHDAERAGAQTDSDLYLFTTGTGKQPWTPAMMMQGHVYEVTLGSVDGGATNVVHKYRPALNGTVATLWDEVTGTYLTVANGGVFAVGNDEHEEPDVPGEGMPTLTSPGMFAAAPTLGVKIKAFNGLSADEKSTVLLTSANNEAYRRELAAAYTNELEGVRLVWDGTTGTCLVNVYRECDGARVFSGKSTTGTAAFRDPEIGRNYRWEVICGENTATGYFHTESEGPRLVNEVACGGFNGRDLGGWETVDGLVTRQGLVFRAGSFDNYAGARSAWWSKTLGVKLDVDLRAATGSDAAPLTSPITGAAIYNSERDGGQQFNPGTYSSFFSNSTYKKAFWLCFAKVNDEANQPVVFHCSAGRDRTGCFAYVLGAVLGMCEDDLATDYYTSWASQGWLDRDSADHVKWLPAFTNGLKGAYPDATYPTVRAKAERYLTDCCLLSGGTEAQAKASIAAFRVRMLELKEAPRTAEGKYPVPVPTAASAADFVHSGWYEIAMNGEVCTLTLNDPANARWADGTEGAVKVLEFHVHAWGAWSADTATKDAGGSQTRTCACGATESRTTPQRWDYLLTDGKGYCVIQGYRPNLAKGLIDMRVRFTQEQLDAIDNYYGLFVANARVGGSADYGNAVNFNLERPARGDFSGSLCSIDYYNNLANTTLVAADQHLYLGYDGDVETSHRFTACGMSLLVDGVGQANHGHDAERAGAQTDSDLHLFTTGTGKQPWTPAKMMQGHVYEVTLGSVDGGATNVVHKYRPAKNDAGVATLWDEVTGTYLTVANGGVFAVGNDAVEPEPPDPTDVIASATVSGDVFRLTFRDVTKPLVLVMFSGATDRGDSYYNDPDAEEMPGWDAVAPVARLLPGTTTLDVPVPAGWGTTVKCARFFATAASKTPWKSLVSIGGTDPAAQWLDTGVVPDATLNTQLNFKPTSATAGKPLFAAATEGANSPYLRYGISLASDGKPTFIYSNSNATSGNGRGESFGSALTVGVEYNALLQATSNRARVRPDGGSWSDSGTSMAPTAAANGTIRVHGSCDITRLTVNTVSYDNKAYMMPALAYNEKGELEACLYDSKTHALRFSLGSQPFAAGAETSYHQDLLRGINLCGETATIPYQASVVKVAKPTVTTSFTYDGKEKTAGVAATGYTVTGNTAKNAGTYTFTAKLASGYQWADGTTADFTQSWSIAAKPISGATTKKCFWTGDVVVPPLYDGSTLLTAGDDYDWNIGGAKTNTNVSAKYSVSFTGKGNYSGTKTIANWEISAVTYTWNGGTSGDWATGPWTCNASDAHWTGDTYKATVSAYPNAMYGHLAVIGAGVTVDLGGKTYAANRTTLDNGARLQNGTLGSPVTYVSGKDAAAPTAYEIENMTFNYVRDTAKSATYGTMQASGYATVNYLGTVNMTVGNYPQFSGTNEGVSYNFRNGATTISSFSFYRSAGQTDQRVTRTVEIENATVSVSQFLPQTNDIVNLRLVLGANNTTASEPLLKAMGSVRLTAGSTFAVDANGKGHGTYPLVRAGNNSWSPYGWNMALDQVVANANANLMGVPSDCVGEVAKTSDSKGLDLVVRRKSVTVMFDGNGNTGGSTDPVTVTPGAVTKLTANGFTRSGHAFLGWAQTPYGAVEFSDQYQVTDRDIGDWGATKTLYAKWWAEDEVVRIREKGDDRIGEILHTGSIRPPAGAQCYYISAQSGDDGNDGRTPETAWKTAAPLNAATAGGTLAAGSYVLFERGGVYRGTVNVASEVTYTAYGTGPKPVIYGSPENGADPSKWTLVAKNVWSYDIGDEDVGTLVFNEGETHAVKVVIRTDKDTGKTYNLVTGGPFSSYADLDTDLHFWHDYANDGKGVYQGTGKVYLYSEVNPGTRFSSIEFNVRRRGFCVATMHDVTIDNFAVKYLGWHGVGASSCTNLVVSNCEFGWIGGSIQSDGIYGRDYPTRFGNGVEVYGACENYVVTNCYVYQAYDAGLTPQYSLKARDGMTRFDQKNVRFADNVIEKCNYSVEYFLGTKEVPDNPSRIENFVIEDNLMFDAGFGFCEQRPDRGVAAHIKGTYAQNRNRATGYVIRNNAFCNSQDTLVQIGSSLKNPDGSSSLPALKSNVFVGHYGDDLGHISETSSTPVLYDEYAEDFVNRFGRDNRCLMLAAHPVDISSGTTQNCLWTGDVIAPPLKVGNRFLRPNVDYAWTYEGLSAAETTTGTYRVTFTPLEPNTGSLTAAWAVTRVTYKWPDAEDGAWEAARWTGTGYDHWHTNFAAYASDVSPFPNGAFGHEAIVKKGVTIDLGATPKSVYRLQLQGDAVQNGSLAFRAMALAGVSTFRNVSFSANREAAGNYSEFNPGDGATVVFEGNNAFGQYVRLRTSTVGNQSFVFKDGDAVIADGYTLWKSTDLATRLDVNFAITNATVELGTVSTMNGANGIYDVHFFFKPGAVDARTKPLLKAKGLTLASGATLTVDISDFATVPGVYRLIELTNYTLVYDAADCQAFCDAMAANVTGGDASYDYQLVPAESGRGVNLVVSAKSRGKAEIGGKTYETLAEACEAAKPGDTLRLLEAPTADDPLVLKPGVTIDLNGTVEKLAEGTYTTPGDWFDVSDKSGQVTIALNDKARPTIGDGGAEPAFVVGDDAVSITVGNVKPNLYYGLAVSVLLGGLESAMPATWQQADAKGDLAPLTLAKPAAARSAFFRVKVSDCGPSGR